MTDLYVSDTVLYIGCGRLPHYTPSPKEKMKREKPSGKNSKVAVMVVTPEEMEKLWK